MKQFFKKIKQTLIYYDFQPLLFFWISSDILNNQVLWTSYYFWYDLGQPNTYWLYLSYLILSLGMISFLHKSKWLARLVTAYLVLYLFSTIRYLVNIYQNINSEPFSIIDVKNITITCWYAFMWSWILFKLKLENLHKSMQND